MITRKSDPTKSPAAAPRKKTAQERAKARERRSDAVVACMGIAMGLGAAFFPWYVFFNQEQFGIKAMRFSGEIAAAKEPSVATPQPIPLPIDLSMAAIPNLELDMASTGTLPDRDDPARSVPVEDQPFPEQVPFRLVHVANGRAMIEDAEGLWVVRPGSVLPDKSRVASIELRDASWVLVTSDQRVIPVQE